MLNCYFSNRNNIIEFINAIINFYNISTIHALMNAEHNELYELIALNAAGNTLLFKQGSKTHWFVCKMCSIWTANAANYYFRQIRSQTLINDESNTIRFDYTAPSKALIQPIINN